MTITQGDTVLKVDDQYSCNPSDNENPCTFYFNRSDLALEADYADLKFTVPCKCALDGG